MRDIILNFSTSLAVARILHLYYHVNKQGINCIFQNMYSTDSCTKKNMIAEEKINDMLLAAIILFCILTD